MPGIYTTYFISCISHPIYGIKTSNYRIIFTFMQYPGFIGYAELNAGDIALLENVYRQRWSTNVKRLQITYLAPLVLYWVLLLVLFIATGSPGSTAEVFIYSKFLVPVYMLITAANVWLLLITMYPIYTDRKQNRKVLIQFTPEPYSVPENGNVYIKTGIPGFLFIEVNYEVYSYIDYLSDLVLEITPKTKIVLSITSPGQTKIIGI